MDIDDILQAYSRAVMHDLRKSTTTSTGELEGYAQRHFMPHECLGVFPADVTPARTKHRCFYIQNTKPSSHAGEHWVAIAREPRHTDIVFDSFARTPSATWMPHLRGMRSTESDVDQFPRDSTHCGQLCLAFGHVFLEHGYDAALQC